MINVGLTNTANIPFTFLDNVFCVEGGWLTGEGIMTMDQYRNALYRNGRNQMNRIQRGGNGRPALIEYNSIPERFKNAIIDKLGYNPTEQSKYQHFKKHLNVDKEAVTFFSNYQLQNGHNLPIEKQKEYHQNAMFLNAIHIIKNETIAIRKKHQGSTKGIMEGIANLVEELRDEYGHTLPGNHIRLNEKLKQYLKEGFTALIHRGYGNNNSRKVNQQLERLILSIYMMNNKPYPSMVRDIYLEFLANKVSIVDLETGELFDRNEFYNDKGLPLVISEATIWNIVNNPKNRAIVDSQRNDFHYYNNLHRPHHHRHRPNYSLSKVSLDDRDLPYGKVMYGGHKIRVKTYYAYDVASGVLIGASYSKTKDKDLFIDCIRDMFGFLNDHDLGFPLEMEVEHHIVNKFSNDLMKAGNVFPQVHFCAPGNSQEKRAEHFNRSKKYGYEKRYNDGIGRHTLSEANRPKQSKVWDDDGMQTKEKIYDFEEIVAIDKYSIDKYNNGLHPDQKKFKGMTRMQVLLSKVNPNTVKFQDHIVAMYAGEKVETSIRRNQYVTVQYSKYQLPGINVIAELDPNNYNVEAYYLPQPSGVIDKVHIFQNKTFLATCHLIEQYNEATAEQTADDLKRFEKQSSFVSSYDSMIRKGKSQTAKLQIVPNDFEDPQVEIHESKEPVLVENQTWELDDSTDYEKRAIDSL